MAAAPVTIGAPTMVSLGNRKMAVATITLTVSGSTDDYTDGGLALPSNWNKTLGLTSKVDVAWLAGPLVASTIDLAHFASIDIANAKLVIYGGASSAAEDVPLEELPAADLTDGTYTATLMAIGY